MITSGYLYNTNTILIALSLAQHHDDATIASALIHEATHARIARNGIAAWPDLRPRIERRCLLEQIDFLERLGNRADLVEYYRSWLGKSWWSWKDRMRRRIDFVKNWNGPAVV